MTTLQPSRDFERIQAALRFVAGRWWYMRLAQRLLVWLAGSLALVGLLGATAGLVNLPGNVRTAMLVVLLAVPAISLALLVIWPLRQRLTPAQAARQIEQQIPELENRFINAVQLADDPLFEPELIRRTLDEIARGASDVPVDRAVPGRRLAIAAAVAGAVGVAFVLLAIFQGDRLAMGLGRIFDPSRQSWVGQVRIDKVRPGDKEVLTGDRLTIELDAHTNRLLDRQPEALLWVRHEGEAGFAPTAMKARRPIGGGQLTGSYFHVFPAVDTSFEYYCSIGATNHRDTPHRITVRQAPQVAALRVTLAYPKYIAHQQPAEPLADGHFEAPLGSVATVTVELNRPIVSAELAVQTADGQTRALRTLPMRPAGSGEAIHRVWSGQIPVLGTAQYRLIFRDEQRQMVGAWPAAARSPRDGEESADPAGTNLFNITARADQPPLAQIARPGQDCFVKPGGSLDLALQASDDGGLTRVRLMTAKVKTGSSPDEQGQWQTEPPAVCQATEGQALLSKAGHPLTSAKFNYTLRLGDRYVEGDRVVYWLEATDNRDLADQAAALGLSQAGPQLGHSPRYIITVADPDQLLARQKRLLEQIAAELAALLREQTAVRVATVALVGHEGATPPEEFAAPAAAVRQGQFDFADHLLRLAKGRIVTFDNETQQVQTSLLVLAYNDSAKARALAGELPGMEDAQQAEPTVRQLTAHQDRVIYALQSLLGLMGQAAQRTEEATTRPDGADLPPEAQARWRQLAEDLDKFIEQQKREIAVTQSLAKKPVDDFTKEDLLKLEELAANQEKWEKFLEKQISDFSKLAEQDFSNPALLKELIEIKTDVVMAKDALQKKAVELAVPLEEAGVELAENLTTHIEKWLPDTPDRDKWSMEEPIEQTDVPMAELPKELQDLVGPLMEEEEDLFEDIEDVTSKWTDSLDKGAGWDAMDGPISNMSAQGVTGNRLPNSSEISGRSGEGRTGQSAGEMVEDEATGKGGRRTPTRLSGDPFQAGQVKDSSKEPPGGATGGGKLSGVAGEGLEGPVPPQLQKQLQRLAQKQAAIRNKAEAVDARFRANNFNNFALQKAITVMRQTEMDLSNHRYQNALRRKAVLVNNLQAQQMLLRGEIQVQADLSPQLPDVVRHDVRNIDESQLPPRYRDLAKQYLQSLSDDNE